MEKELDDLKRNARIAVSKLCAKLPNNSRGVELDALAFFQKFAVTPDQLPKEMLRPIGRIVWYDIGFVAIAFRN